MTGRNERVCPRCGEPAGEQRFCPSCGLNIAAQPEMPSHDEWRADQAHAVTFANDMEQRTEQLPQAEKLTRALAALDAAVGQLGAP